MASLSNYSLLLLTIIITIGETQARPCKTLFISSFTISSFKNPSNPNNNFIINPNTEPPKFFTIFDFYPTQTHQLQTQPLQIFIDRQPLFLDTTQFPKYPRAMRAENNKPNVVTSSLRERTKDILSVVVALLFGVGCGALTSATMYLAWSLITNRFEEGHDDGDFSDDDDVASFKKMGYCKIPDDAAKAPAPVLAKEVV